MSNQAQVRRGECLTPGNCFDSFGQTRLACPPVNFSGEPIDVAENLCPRAMHRNLEVSDRDTAHTIFKNAWAGVELGLSIGTEQPGTAAALFERARQQLDLILGHSENDGPAYHTGTITRLGASALRTFLPAFEARSKPDNTFGEAECIIIYEELVKAIAQLTPKERRDSRGHLIEIEVMGLFARTSDTQRLAYPSSPREERSSTKRSLNHDVYQLRPDRAILTKLPIQIKASSNGNSRRTKGARSLRSTTSDAVPKLFYKEDVLEPAGVEPGKTLADELIADANGTIDSEGRHKLHIATRAVLGFVDSRLGKAE